jgi:YbgC/YbaW family acyl-CoA thioester hydrolase
MSGILPAALGAQLTAIAVVSLFSACPVHLFFQRGACSAVTSGLTPWVAVASRFLHRRRVRFHETDLAGIVHFSNFFKFMEEAEHAFLRSVGLSIHPDEDWRNPVRRGWPRVSAACDFHIPLQFDDEIEIELLVAEMRTTSIRYRCYLWKDPDGERIKAATGEMVVVSVMADREAGTIQSAPIPESFREKIEVAANLGE